MKSGILDIIPKSFRGRSIWVAATILVRALLNFIGLAMLVPVLVLILDTDSIHQSSRLNQIYEALGFIKTGTRAHYYQNPTEDACLYKKDNDTHNRL